MNKSIKIPQYRQLYETLRKQILQGVYKAGELLPSEHDLYQKHSVTQPTIRQALALLVNDGYIKKHQGKGSIVQELPKGLGILSIEGRLANSHNSTENLSTKIITRPKPGPWREGVSFTPTSEELSREFFYIERQRRVGDSVIFYEQLQIPNSNLPGFASRKLENRSLYELLLRHYQIGVTGGEQKLWAVQADKVTAAYLEIKRGRPVLRLERRIDTNRIGFSIYTSLFVNTEKYLLQGLI